MDEKTLIEEDNRDTIAIDMETSIPDMTRSPSPPAYEVDDYSCPPPPTYSLSTTRLHYKNKPFISELDEIAFANSQERQYQQHQDNWSEIIRLPFHQRLKYYTRSWLDTIYDARLVLFILFIIMAIAAMIFAFVFLANPNLLFLGHR